MKKSVIKSVNAQTRVANLIVRELQNAFTMFSDAPVAEIEDKGQYFAKVVVKNEHSHMLVFAEIDVTRSIVDAYCRKYQGMFYTIQTRPYISKFDASTMLYQPVFEICVRRYDKDEL